MDQSSKKRRQPSPNNRRTAAAPNNHNSGRATAGNSRPPPQRKNSKDDLSQRSSKSGKNPMQISTSGRGPAGAVNSGSGRKPVQCVIPTTKKKPAHQGENSNEVKAKHHQKDQHHKEAKDDHDRRKHAADSGKNKKSIPHKSGSKAKRHNPGIAPIGSNNKKRSETSSDDERQSHKGEGKVKKSAENMGDNPRRSTKKAAPIEEPPLPKRDVSCKEVKATKFEPAEGRDKDKSREENELTEVEADKPAQDKESIIVKNGGRFSIGDKTYEIVNGCVQGDYGACTLKDVENPTELLTFRYETLNSKCKRIKTECMVQVVGTAAQRTHFLRLLLRGSIDNYQLRYMITDALGLYIPDALKTLSSPHFSTSTALRLSYETLDCIEDIHKIGYIHRDVKPMSFAFGLNPNHTKLYVTNLGLAKRYRHDMKMLPARKAVPFMGTVKYASRTVHERGERSRKDDLESWVFMIIEFIDERILSWRKSLKKDEIYQEKCSFMSVDGFSKICNQYKQIPEEFRPLIHYVMSLEFSSLPDYLYIKKTLKEAMDKRKILPDEPWEWEMLEADQKTEKRKATKAVPLLKVATTQSDE